MTQPLATPRADLPEPEPFTTDLFTLALPQLPKAWDSVMFGLLKECPRKFKYIIIDQWQPPGFAAHLMFGLAYHKALEVYDIDKASGVDPSQALLNAIEFCCSYGTRLPDGRFQAYDSMFTNEPAKTRDTLLRSVIWYLEHFKHDNCKTVILSDGTAAVELPFKINLEMDTPDGEPFILCGHLDRLVELQGDFYFLDRKTSKNQINARYWNQFTPSNQMSLYYAATQLVLSRPAKGGIIDAVEIGASYSRFHRHTLHRTKGQQEEWLQDTYVWLGLAMQFAESQQWPMNDKSCGNYGGCPFQIICSRDPKVRDKFLEAEGYHKRAWNPLEAR